MTDTTRQPPQIGEVRDFVRWVEVVAAAKSSSPTAGSIGEATPPVEMTNDQRREYGRLLFEAIRAPSSSWRLDELLGAAQYAGVEVDQPDPTTMVFRYPGISDEIALATNRPPDKDEVRSVARLLGLVFDKKAAGRDGC